MVHRMDDRRLSVKVLVGITIAAIGLELPVLAVPPPSPLLVAQVACVVNKTTPVFTTANPEDSAALLSLPLTDGTAVVFVAPLPTNPPARVQIKKPSNGFVDYAALDCGRTLPPPPQAKSSVCRIVKNTLGSVYVFREPNWQSKPIASAAANQPVYVTQLKGSASVTSQRDANGGVWVEVDLQKTFGKNFGISPSVGWLFNSSPGDSNTTLGTGNRCP